MATDYGSFEWPPTGSGSGSGVSSLNSITGAVVIEAGAGITVTPSGQDITISATGAELVFSDSIVNTAGTVTLVGDTVTPGDSKYYGTNSGGTLGYYSLPSGSGTVTSVSVVSTNGFAGTVATATTTPAITLETSITGILQGNGTAISAATTGNFTDSSSLADGITVSGGTGAVLGSGTSISQAAASTSQNGYLTSTDWNTFNGKQATGNYATSGSGDVSWSAPSGAGPVTTTLATVNSNTGTFASVTVNGKGLVTAAAALSGDATTSNSALTLATVNSNTGTFASVTVNGKGLVTAAAALSGDATTSNSALTLATVNSNTGTFGSAIAIPSFTVNGKGLITAASSNTYAGANNVSYYSSNVSQATGSRVQFNNKNWDVLSLVTTGASWVFTAGIAGKYQVNAKISVTNIVSTSELWLSIFAGTNGSEVEVSRGPSFNQASSSVNPGSCSVNDLISLTAGQDFYIVYTTNAGTFSTLTNTYSTTLSAFWVGV